MLPQQGSVNSPETLTLSFSHLCHSLAPSCTFSNYFLLFPMMLHDFLFFNISSLESRESYYLMLSSFSSMFPCAPKWLGWAVAAYCCGVFLTINKCVCVYLCVAVVIGSPGKKYEYRKLNICTPTGSFRRKKCDQTVLYCKYFPSVVISFVCIFF